MKRILLSVLIVVPALSLALGHATGKAVQQNQSAIEKEISQLESRRFQAMMQADTAVLDSILSDELTYIHTSGQVDTKAQFIEALRSGELKYESISPDDVKVRIHKAAAVVAGHARMKVKSRGQTQSFSIRFLDVYARRNDRWQMVAWQSTRVPEQ
jgi:hypothetical protein